jgi:hypothetical protein
MLFSASVPGGFQWVVSQKRRITKSHHSKPWIIAVSSSGFLLVFNGDYSTVNNGINGLLWSSIPLMIRIIMANGD